MSHWLSNADSMFWNIQVAEAAESKWIIITLSSYICLFLLVTPPMVSLSLAECQPFLGLDKHYSLSCVNNIYVDKKVGSMCCCGVVDEWRWLLWLRVCCIPLLYTVCSRYVVEVRYCSRYICIGWYGTFVGVQIWPAIWGYRWRSTWKVFLSCIEYIYIHTYKYNMYKWYVHGSVLCSTYIYIHKV